VGDVPCTKNAFNIKVHPSGGQIGQRDAPILLAFIHMRFIRELKHPIPLGKITLVISTLVFVGDTQVEAKEG
jgi:hypothetical protein